LNFVASQDVESRKVTVAMENVAPKDALEAIVTANGLAYSKKSDSNIFLVYPARSEQQVMETRVFHLKNARLSDSPLDIGGMATIGDLSALASATSSSSGGTSTTTSSTSPVDQDRGIDKLVAKLISPTGKIALDVRTNSLIVTDTAEVLDKIQKVLNEVDIPAPQVILDVHVVEVDKSLLSDQGVDWGGTNGALGTLTGGSRTTAFPFEEQIFANSKGLRSSSVTDSGALAPANLTLGTLNAANFTATLRFVMTDSHTKILARPRVLTQNNEAATIKLVTNAATSSTTTTTTTSTTAGTVTREEVGVNLKMTPQINADDSILLFLEPSVSTIATSEISTTASPVLDKTTRMVRTIARVKNDQTLVIGGLINDNKSQSKKKIPFFGDLPGVGGAFSYTSGNNEERELLVFVTPHIVKGFNSLGDKSATAQGRDIAVRRMLDTQMDRLQQLGTDAFADNQTIREDLYSNEQALVRASEKRSSNPVVEKQMTQALDALDPNLAQKAMAQSLDTWSPKKYKA
jgi:type IV pilus secretin PilQ/predicted competence protein